MALQKAAEVHSKLLKTASKFLSPALKQYFTRKADRDFEKVKSAEPSAAQKYIAEQSQLNDSLDRVVGIYNMYRDDRTTF